MPPNPEPTPAPSPTLLERDSVITTVSVYASDTSTPVASGSTSLPIGPIVGGLVGGILGGLVIAGIIYWCWVRKNKERDARHRAAVSRRNRKRQAAIAAQEAKAKARAASDAVAASRAARRPANSPMNEKDLASGLTIPVAAYSPTKESGYGYSPQQSPIGETPDYAAQYLAAVDEPDTDNNRSYAPEPEETPMVSNVASTGKIERPSRSKARMAAAESAVANASGDPNSRYRPTKPSPLKLAAAAKAEEQRLAELRSGGNEGWDDAPQSQRLSAQSAGPDPRKVSGEWGVALGSPDGDGRFSMDQTGSHYSFTSSDPYLNNGSSGDYQSRGPSGHYTSDPYAVYHHDDDQIEEIDYAAPLNGGAKKGGSWV